MNHELYIWGLSLTNTLLLVATFLIVIDFFIVSDIPTLFAWVLVDLSIVLNVEEVFNVDFHFITLSIFFILILFPLTAFHYFVWNKLLRKIVNLIAPDKFHVGADGKTGSKGFYVVSESKTFVRIDGELWPCLPTDSSNLIDGQEVVITGMKDGILTIEKFIN